ncbi:hypothetical protein O181_062304 [Austropuccinia psidii MF-1]|uniref:Peptidyl-prolyl cis-trans isomerase n=1 Tax=Austropuccinia psidii MF-1 TaxID=1389203 RepID=A0A9Q3EK45_9BASI|nr:hypothetical protein [Austropuccinia psidii MF-1]
MSKASLASPFRLNLSRKPTSLLVPSKSNFSTSAKNFNNETKPKPLVYFNISVDKVELGKILFKLYDEQVPKTAQNFRQLSLNPLKDPIGSYKNSKFHRIIPQFMLQGGDFTRHNGTGGRSIYGDKFDDENFIFKHDKPGLLSMANAGPNTNGSQFFITTVKTSWLDGKHVVFGEVVEGYDIVKEIEKLGSLSGKPKAEVVIGDCGEVSENGE